LRGLGLKEKVPKIERKTEGQQGDSKGTKGEAKKKTGLKKIENIGQ